jgi:hypothetical protein
MEIELRCRREEVASLIAFHYEKEFCVVEEKG